MVFTAANALQPLGLCAATHLHGCVARVVSLPNTDLPDCIRPDIDRDLCHGRTREDGSPDDGDRTTQRRALEVAACGVAPGDRAALYVQHAAFHHGTGAR